jgi:hypothetical protein
MQNCRSKIVVAGVEPESVCALRWVIIVERLPGRAAVGIASKRIGTLNLINFVGIACS